MEDHSHRKRRGIMIYRTILVVLIGLTMFALYACDQNNVVKSTDDLGRAQPPQDTTPPDPPLYIDTLTVGAVLYVAEGGTGSGTSASPYGSIQQAIDAASLAGGVHTIFIGTGTFNETLTLAPGVHLRGKRNPGSDWEVSPLGYTNIVSTSLSGHSVAVVAEDLDQQTVLENLRIEAGDAPDPGASSVGIYSINSDSLTLIRCLVQAGAGGNGVDGAVGANGATGQAGTVDDPNYGDPRCGGRGGLGPDPCPDGVRGDGEAGFCGDGSQTGGTGGLGEGTTSTEIAGVTGPDGTAGDAGRAGVMTMALDAALLPMFQIDSGVTGIIGIAGCGGGGGGSGPCYYDWDSLPDTVFTGVENGGWGGWGGEPGMPGSGGTGAGSSVAVMVHSGTVLLENTKLVALAGGTGGAGGDGGSGGGGGNGSGTVRPSGLRYPGEAGGGRGGRGGAGGAGGPGGGGTGGHSISLALYQASVAFERDNTYVHGPAGDGGASDGNAGPDGVSESVYTIP